MNVRTHMSVPEERVLGDRDELVRDPQAEILRLCWLQWNKERLMFGGVKRVLPAPFPPVKVLTPEPQYKYVFPMVLTTYGLANTSMSREVLHNMMRSNRDNVG